MDDTIFLKKLGERIAKLRKEKKLTQIEVSYRCEFDRSNYKRIEVGNTNPTSLTLKKIAEALEVPIEDFFKFETKEKAKK